MSYKDVMKQYDLHMADGTVIQMLPKNSEFLSYFHSWLNGTWPSKDYSVSAIDGRDYLLTSPSNILFIEVIRAKAQS